MAQSIHSDVNNLMTVLHMSNALPEGKGAVLVCPVPCVRTLVLDSVPVSPHPPDFSIWISDLTNPTAHAMVLGVWHVLSTKYWHFIAITLSKWHHQTAILLPQYSPIVALFSGPFLYTVYNKYFCQTPPPYQLLSVYHPSANLSTGSHSPKEYISK